MKILLKLLFTSTMVLGFSNFNSQALASTVSLTEETNNSVVIHDDEIIVTPIYMFSSELSFKMPNVKDSYFAPRGTGRPSFSNYKTLGIGAKQTFGGSSAVSALYSEQNTRGLNSATIEITNKKNNAMTAQLYKQEKTSSGEIKHTAVATFNSPKNSTMGWSVSNLNSNTNYYMKFNAPSDFVGFILRDK